MAPVAVPVDAPDVVVDAVIGYSLGGAPRGRALELIERARRCRAKGSTVISLDIASGVDATTGERPGAFVEPDVTMTLALPKHGLAGSAGGLLLADIGIPVEVYRVAGLDVSQPVFDDRYVIPLVVS